ncbi:hypothetical protein DL768_001617 [Monosporascus sp. mg162]|nr:hypothetical protein DL768_001617 [Monosporascus sp. mg162]
MRRAGLFADAISEFYEAIVQDPESAMGFYSQMATALRSIGQYEKAVETLTRAMEIAGEGDRKGSVIPTLLASVEIHRLMGQNKECFLLLLKRAHECDPSDLFVTEQLAAAYSVNGLFNEAFSLYENAGTEKGRNEEHFGLAQMVQVSESYEQAKVLPEKLQDLYQFYQGQIPKHLRKNQEIASRFTYWLGNLFCFELNDARTAANVWNEAIRACLLGSEEARSRFAPSEVLIEFGQCEEAESILEENCDCEAQYISRCYLLFRGKACSRIGKVDQANDWYLRGIQYALHRIDFLDNSNDNFGRQMQGNRLPFMSLDNDARIAFRQRIYTNTIRDPARALRRAFCDVCYDSAGIMARNSSDT